MDIDHSFYMNLALQEAWKYQLLTYPNPPVGALTLDKNGKILSIEAHQKAGSEHAELRSIISALKDNFIDKLKTPNEKHSYIIDRYQDHFKGATIYTTLEPCNHYGSTPPCSLLIEKLGFERVVCGVLDENQKASGGLKRLESLGINVATKVLEEECKELVSPFLKWQKGDRFMFFKIALSLNGVYDGGIISSKESRLMVHKIRDKIDLLIIGGESVRVDRPTLDSRMINGKAPDVLIFSKRDDFDRDIPLFKVKNRKVFIQDNLSGLDRYKFVMVESGGGLLDTLRGEIDWYLIMRSPHMKVGKSLQAKKDLKILHCTKNSFDTIEWLKEI